MIRWIVWLAIVPLGAAPLTRPYTAENYDVNLRVDPAKQLLYGEVRIRLHSQADTAISALELDAGGLRIMSVQEGEAPQSFDRNHGLLFVALANPLRGDQPRTITIRYEAGPAAGLKFFPDQIYASVARSDWMPCDDRPGERATLHLTMAAPSDTKAAASGQLTAATRASDGQSITEWQLDSPTEPSWFGFALGSFAENISDAEGVKLRVLGAGAPILEPTAAAIHYLAERTGKHYPGQTYTQVFIHGDAIRSLAAGLTLLPESHAPGWEKQPDNLRLLARELAHQWYGLGIATKDWSDLWLNEGVSAFVADAFLGQRFGKERYERELASSRQIYNRLRAGGKDRPLADSEWTTRQDADGEIPEHKGAWFLYLVNQLVGDNVFWNGLRLYTNDKWGQSATSEDLRKAFDSAGIDNSAAVKKGGAVGKRKSAKSTPNSPSALDNLFDMWVYGIGNNTKSRQAI